MGLPIDRHLKKRLKLLISGDRIGHMDPGICGKA
jgi:hypothetical protein